MKNNSGVPGDLDTRKQKKEWCVYMIRCSDDSLYTGISTDTVRRFQQHCGQQGAKYFRGRRPKQLVYLEKGHTRGSATKREAEIKKLPRKKKLMLIESGSNDIKSNAFFIKNAVVEE